ncbi:MAG: PRD domain-containing protein [Lachnospiraceae bacterium]|nr:PRD domain-containing protein [Lachnospiraceae bacterium]
MMMIYAEVLVDRICESRFASHMHYLLKRGRNNHLLESSNGEIFYSVREDYPDTYKCAVKVKEYISKAAQIDLAEEELVYLMLHINRLCSREDCNQ